MAARSDRLRKQGRKVTKEDVRKNLRQLRATVSERYEQRRGKVHEFAHKSVQFIVDRPFGPTLIAAGIGLVLGRFWFHRCRARRRTDDAT
jgi:ElaB/YqjD/DUF883 family membrane-anchored ribosome-binding protein